MFRSISLKSCQRVLSLLLFLSFFSGCSFWGDRAVDPVVKPYTPVNFSPESFLPNTVQRVALLPLYWGDDGDARFLESFDATILSELTKTLDFEVIPIYRYDLLDKFSHNQIDSRRPVPHSVVNWVKETYQVDAILFIDLSVYNPYKPISIGFRCKLVETDELEVLWAADNVFDSANPEVLAGALSYVKEKEQRTFPLDTSDTILYSPNHFAAYAAFMTFKYLPQRR